MASFNENAVSFIGPTAQDISKLPREGIFGRDSFTAVAAMKMPVKKSQHPLPTPPNSISPNLPPHGLKAAHGKSLTKLEPLNHVDSDLDLQDGASQGLISLSRDAFAAQSLETDNTGFETAGDITPALLAKHYLPRILLDHGALTIKHITGFLTTSVPGFSGIAPAKARRLVVGALEGKGRNGEGGGLNGDVQFKKTGWGRWEAKTTGQAWNSQHERTSTSPSSYPSSFSGTAGVPISGPAHSYTRTRLPAQSSSWADGSDAVFSHDSDDDIMMLEDIADKMSLDGEDDDGSASCSSSEAPDEDDLMGDDPNDVTDDEDWAAVGAAALRQSSYKASGTIQSNNFLSSKRLYNANFSSSYTVRPPLSTMAKSAPMFVHMNPTSNRANINEVMNMGTNGVAASRANTFGSSSLRFHGVGDEQEREAIEALLKLGSV